MDHRDFGSVMSDLRAGDEERMAIKVNYYDDELDGDVTHELPAKYEVCPTCNGKGKHVNPGVDSHGISAQEFCDDPGFAEEYFSGMYDVQCHECKGKRVVLEPDMDQINESEDLKKIYDVWQEAINDHISWVRESEAERRYGA